MAEIIEIGEKVRIRGSLMPGTVIKTGSEVLPLPTDPDKSWAEVDFGNGHIMKLGMWELKKV